MTITSNFSSKHFFLLILLLLISHFLPFERLSVGPDDYAFLTLEFDKNWLGHFFINPSRPFQYIWFDLQNFIVGSNSFYGLIFTLLINSINILFVYIFFIVVFQNNIYPFLLTVIYILLFNRNEIYHYPNLTHIIIASSFYIASLISCILFTKNHNKYLIFLSIFLYTVGIFWYEAGFFLPIVVFYILFIYSNHNIQKFTKIYFFLYILILIFYSFWRISGGLGSVEYFSGRSINLLLFPNAITDSFHHILGKYFIKNIIYGFYNFFKIELSWLITIIVIDSIFIVYFFKIINKISRLNTFKKNITFAFILIIVFLIPSILSGSVAPRSLIISSIGICIIIFFIFNMFNNKFFKNIFIIYIIFSLIVSHGISWTHVVSSRINGSIFTYLVDNKQKLIDSSVIIFDTKSFALNIPYTFSNNEYNILNTYYGAQTFEHWGLKSMVKVAVGYNKINKPIYIAIDDIKKTNGKNIEFSIFNRLKYNEFNKNLFQVPQENAFIISYENVYSNN